MNRHFSSAAAFLFAALPLALGSAACDGRFVTPGESADSRPLPEIQTHAIFHGEAAPSPDYDATLSVYFLGMGICTATLITPTAAVTSAHCIYVDCDYDENGRETECRPVMDASYFSLGAGSSERTHQLGLRNATKVHVHERYAHNLLLNDIALLEFDRPFTLSNPLVTEASKTISIYVYEKGINGQQYSLTTAVGLFQSVICVIFLLMRLRKS